MDESFEKVLEPGKRKRSSILKADKRVSRESRTVSFNERCIYKELHQDGTCEITKMFLQEDMDLTMMDIIDNNNQTINSSHEMSIDQQASVQPATQNNSTLSEDKMIDSENDSGSVMDLTLVSQFISTMPKVNSIEIPAANYDTSTVYEKNMSGISLASSVNSSRSSSSKSSKSSKSSESTIKSPGSSINESQATSYLDQTLVPTAISECSITRMSEISSLNQSSVQIPTLNETFFGAFHDSNNISIQSRSSDTLMHNVEALEDCIEKVDQELKDSTRRLDEEIEDLFKFYRHVVNKDNKYEFAIKIFGLRHSLWLIIRLNPEIYPNEKLGLRFAVNRRDRHLYPFPEYAEAVKRCTKEGSHGYLTKFVINSQKFRRFLRTKGYRKPNK